MRFVFAPLRAVLFVLHVFAGLAIVLVVFPLAGLPARNRINRAWSRTLVAICGARLIVDGEPIPPHIRITGLEPWSLGRLVLSNHVSWIDVFAINAVTPCRFVAKAEIGQWPLLGALVSRSGTLYIERGRRHAVAAMNHKVRDHLKAGESVVVFPEGTTSDGTSLLPFHSNLLAPAVEIGAPVWPIAIRYTDGGRPTDAAAFIGDMGLITSLVKILTARDLAIRITVLPAIPVEEHGNRHAVGRAAREAIAGALGVTAGERETAPA
ncbi:MAG TPA: 1-acyl-sn-glycerol-3-phosphate acyltransferase [Burkholderiaceae bacterium]|nr:1-acyl-sn-glycerol-3-phosphate acyltransferase [Burkholderiaceae bacterium]